MILFEMPFSVAWRVGLVMAVLLVLAWLWVKSVMRP